MVSQRTKEIGVRMALGAKTGSVVAMILRQGVGLALCGAAIGVAAAAAGTRLFDAVLYGAPAGDWRFSVGAVAIVGCVSGQLDSGAPRRAHRSARRPQTRMKACS
jgi:putative ABC transport system permease protein